MWADGRLDPKPFFECRGEDEVPALPRTARDSDTAAWVASGLEERQSEEQAADRTSSEVSGFWCFQLSTPYDQGTKPSGVSARGLYACRSRMLSWTTGPLALLGLGTSTSRCVAALVVSCQRRIWPLPGCCESGGAPACSGFDMWKLPF